MVRRSHGIDGCPQMLFTFMARLSADSVQVQELRAAQERLAQRGQGVDFNRKAALGSPGLAARPAREILAGKPQLARRGGPSVNLSEGRVHEVLLVRGSGFIQQ